MINAVAEKKPSLENLLPEPPDFPRLAELDELSDPDGFSTEIKKLFVVQMVYSTDLENYGKN